MSCDETGSVCCNFFGLDGLCTLDCPANSSSNSNFQCVCNLGFQSSGTNCNETNECLPNPCQNGGTCSDLINDYSCACSPGYSDKNCSTDIDECSPNPCLNDGSCDDLVNNYICSCTPQFTGLNCSVNISTCPWTPCLNGGDCREGMCICQEHWKGTQCAKCDSPFCKKCEYSTTNNETSCSECNDGYNLDQSTLRCSKLITLMLCLCILYM